MAHYQLGQAYLRERQYAEALKSSESPLSYWAEARFVSPASAIHMPRPEKELKQAILNDVKNRPNAACAPELAVVYAGLDR